MIDRTQANIHENDIGIKFFVRVRTRRGIVDLSQAIEVALRFRRPDQSGFQRLAELKTDGTDGYIQYVSVGGDLIPAGHWALQAVVTLSAECILSSNLSMFIVYPNILITPPPIHEFPLIGITVTDEGEQQGSQVRQLDFVGQVDVTETPAPDRVEIHIPEITTVDGGELV